MPENTAKARKAVDGHRSHIRAHIEKYKSYTVDYDKNTMVKQIQNAQNQIAKLRQAHPSIPSSSEDTWRP